MLKKIFCRHIIILIIFFSCSSKLTRKEEKILKREVIYFSVILDSSKSKDLFLKKSGNSIFYRIIDVKDETCVPTNYNLSGYRKLNNDTLFVFSSPKLKMKTEELKNEISIKFNESCSLFYDFNIYNEKVFISKQFKLPLNYYINRSPKINFKEKRVYNWKNIELEIQKYIQYKRFILNDETYSSCVLYFSDDLLIISDFIFFPSFDKKLKNNLFDIYIADVDNNLKYLNQLGLKYETLTQDEREFVLNNMLEYLDSKDSNNYFEKNMENIVYSRNTNYFQLHQAYLYYPYYKMNFNIDYWVEL